MRIYTSKGTKITLVQINLVCGTYDPIRLPHSSDGLAGVAEQIGDWGRATLANFFFSSCPMTRLVWQEVLRRVGISRVGGNWQIEAEWLLGNKGRLLHVVICSLLWIPYCYVWRMEWFLHNKIQWDIKKKNLSHLLNFFFYKYKGINC